MSILDGIKDKAKDLLSMTEPFITRQTRVYDASKNRVIVAGMTIDGLVSSTLSADTLTRQEQGIDYYYATCYQALEQRTLTITVLPTASCLNTLRLLALKQQQSKGWFNIAIHENNSIVNVYRGWILNLPEISMSQDSADRQIVFGVKPMHSGVSVIDQPTDFEQDYFSKYGISPERSGSKNESVFDESNGRRLDDVILEPLPQDNSEQPYQEPNYDAPNDNGLD